MQPSRYLGTPFDHSYPYVMAAQLGSTTNFNLDVNNIFEEIQFRLTGTCTNAAYTTNPTIRTEAALNLLSAINFTGNAKTAGTPTVNFSTTDAAYLKLKTAIVEGTFPNSAGIGAANGAYAFEENFTKYFGVKRIPALTNWAFLDSRILQALKINFNWRTIAAVQKPGSGVAGTTVLSNVQVTVHALEWVNGAPTTGNPYVSETQRTIDLTNNNGLDQDFLNVPVGNILLRQYFKGTVGDVNYADPSDAFFTTPYRAEGAHVKTVLNGIKPWMDQIYTHLQIADRKRFSLESWPVGYAVQEYSRTGLIQDALNLRLDGPNTVNACKNQADITPVGGQTNTLQITDEQLITVPSGS